MYLPFHIFQSSKHVPLDPLEIAPAISSFVNKVGNSLVGWQQGSHMLLDLIRGPTVDGKKSPQNWYSLKHWNSWRLYICIGIHTSVNKHIHSCLHTCVCVLKFGHLLSHTQAFNLPLRSNLSCDLRRFYCGTSYGKVWSLSVHAYALRFFVAQPFLYLRCCPKTQWTLQLPPKSTATKRVCTSLGFLHTRFLAMIWKKASISKQKRQVSWAESFTLEILLGTTSCSQETRATNLTGSRWRGAYSQSVMCLECVCPYSYETVHAMVCNKHSLLLTQLDIGATLRHISGELQQYLKPYGLRNTLSNSI